MDNLKPIIECLLFVTDEPLTMDRLTAILPAVEGKDIRQALSELAAEYESRGGGFYLKQVAGGYQLRTRPEYKTWVQELVKPTPLRLSRAALETLAIIAYKQPIIRADVEHIRGVDSGGVLRMLLERKLIRVLGRKEIPGRPMIYATTKRFLELFDLRDLRDLPTPKEIEALGTPEEPISHEQTELPLKPPEVQPSADPTEIGAEPISEHAPVMGSPSDVDVDSENDSEDQALSVLETGQPDSGTEGPNPQTGPFGRTLDAATIVPNSAFEDAPDGDPSDSELELNAGTYLENTPPGHTPGAAADPDSGRQPIAEVPAKPSAPQHPDDSKLPASNAKIEPETEEEIEEKKGLT